LSEYCLRYERKTISWSPSGAAHGSSKSLTLSYGRATYGTATGPCGAAFRGCRFAELSNSATKEGGWKVISTGRLTSLSRLLPAAPISDALLEYCLVKY